MFYDKATEYILTHHLVVSVSDGFLQLDLNVGNGFYRLSTSALGRIGGRVADGRTHVISVDFGQDNPVLVIDGVAVSGRPYGDNIFPNENVYVGKWCVRSEAFCTVSPCVRRAK